MASNVTYAKDFDASKVEFGQLKSLDSGAKMVMVTYKGNPLVVQTPEMYAPYGLSQYNTPDGGAPKFTLDLSFRDKEDPARQSLMNLYKQLSAMDSVVKEAAFDNAVDWFKKKKTKDAIEDQYKPIVRHPRDKVTQEITDKYPPTFQLKMNFNPKTDAFACEVYDVNDNEVDIRKLQTKGAKITAIAQCTGIWVAGGMFGCSWKAMLLLVKPRAALTGPRAFKRIQEDMITDDEEMVSAASATPGGGGGGMQDSTVIADSDDEGDAMPEAVVPDTAQEEQGETPADLVEDDEEEEVLVKPKKKVVRKKA